MLTIEWSRHFLQEGWSTLEDILTTSESLCCRISIEWTIQGICQWTTADRKRENLEKNKNPKKTIWCGSTKFQRNFCKYVLPACCRTFKTTKVMSLHPLTYWHWNFPNLERTSEMYFPFAWCIVALLGIDQDADSSNSLMHSFLHFEHISFIYSFFSLMHPFLHFEHISFIHSFFSFIHRKNILFMHSILHPYWTHLIYAFRSSFIVNRSRSDQTELQSSNTKEDIQISIFNKPVSSNGWDQSTLGEPFVIYSKDERKLSFSGNTIMYNNAHQIL